MWENWWQYESDFPQRGCCCPAFRMQHFTHRCWRLCSGEGSVWCMQILCSVSIQNTRWLLDIRLVNMCWLLNKKRNYSAEMPKIFSFRSNLVTVSLFSASKHWQICFLIVKSSIHWRRLSQTTRFKGSETYFLNQLLIVCVEILYGHNIPPKAEQSFFLFTGQISVFVTFYANLLVFSLGGD